MSRVNYPTTSPYASTPQNSWSIGRFVFRPVSADRNDQPFVLEPRHQHRPDLLANELYGTPAYWWVFSVRNPELRRDPIWDFTTGKEIMVPSADYLSRVLGT